MIFNFMNNMNAYVWLYISFMCRDHVQISIYYNYNSLFLFKVRLATITLAVMITAFLISFHGIIGVPVDKFSGAYKDDILPMEDRYFYGVIYSPFLLFVHLLLAVCFYKWGKEICIVFHNFIFIQWMTYFFWIPYK